MAEKWTQVQGEACAPALKPDFGYMDLPQQLRKVLLIDDDRGQAKIVDASFAKFVGEKFQLHWAPNFEDGLLALRCEHFTACLLDYQLGPESGLDLLREVKRLEIDTPVVMLTSDSALDVDTKAMNLGALDYLVKQEMTPRGLERSLRYAIKLHATLGELRRMATRDMLTGLFNRREGVRLIEREVERARQTAHALTVLMIDIDNFKGVNDRLGHDAGDRILAAVAKAILGAVREVDMVVRWGGDEFAVWVVDADAVTGRRLGEAIVAAVHPLDCTVSVGMAEWNGARDDAPDLLVAADRALYEAKNSGRDRVA